MEKSSFFNSVSGDRKYKAEDWASYFSSIIGNGVFPIPSTGLQVVAGNGMQVTVKPGKAWTNGYFYNNTSDLALTLATADGVLKRIDRIVIQWNLTDRTIRAKIKSSSFNAYPTAPTLQRDADIYELALADVYVGAGVTAITQSNITDQRLNTYLCGVVAAAVDQIDTESFNAQLQAWFQEYSSNAQDEFQTWFDGIKDILDENTASNLLNMIQNLTASDVGADAAGAADTVQTNLTNHTNDTVKHITAAERTAWNSKAAGNHTHTPASIGAATAYTYGTTDMTAGTTALATGTLYLMYE